MHNCQTTDLLQYVTADIQAFICIVISKLIGTTSNHCSSKITSFVSSAAPHHRYSSVIRGYQPSVTELFQLLRLVPGTVFRSTSHLRSHCRSSSVALRESIPKCIHFGIDSIENLIADRQNRFIGRYRVTDNCVCQMSVSYTHLTLPTNREV